MYKNVTLRHKKFHIGTFATRPLPRHLLSHLIFPSVPAHPPTWVTLVSGGEEALGSLHAQLVVTSWTALGSCLLGPPGVLDTCAFRGVVSLWERDAAMPGCRGDEVRGGVGTLP